MANDLVLFLAKINLALAASVLLVLALRRPVRAAFGAGSAYALWLVAPLSVLALLIPARTLAAPASVLTQPMAAASRAPSPSEAANKS